SWLKGGFALRGEELWAASTDGAIRLAGNDWRVFPEALERAVPTSITTSQRGVWMLDEGGSLAFFDGANWSHRATPKAIPDPNNPEAPEVATTQDGRLWLYRAGLCTEDGNSWRELQPTGVATNTAYWIGAGQDRVWLWDWCNSAIAAV